MDTKRLHVGTTQLQRDIKAIELLVGIVFDLTPSAEFSQDPTELVRIRLRTTLSPSHLRQGVQFAVVQRL